jgi:cyclase
MNMAPPLNRRQFLTRTGAALAVLHGMEHFDPCCANAADAETAGKELFELRPVADGVYAAIAAPRYKVNCNAAVIMTNDGVVVVDSHSKPSAAVALYQEIQSITRQPVKRVINTHFHWDHWQGNQIYREAFPGLEIISSKRTRESLEGDAGNGGVPFIDKQIKALPDEIAKLQAEVARSVDAAQKARLESNLRQAEDYLEELKTFYPALPNRTFDETVALDFGGRQVELLLLGRGHTDGDVFIRLPKEKVVITGDALIDWMPFMNDAFPEDWVGTLDNLAKYDFDSIIPGHGGVAGRDQMAFFRGYLADLVDSVKKAHAAGGSLDEMKKTLPELLAGKYEKGMSKYPLGQYRDRIGGNIEIAYRKVIAGT